MQLHLFDQFVLDGVGDLGWRFHDDVFHDPKRKSDKCHQLVVCCPAGHRTAGLHHF